MPTNCHVVRCDVRLLHDHSAGQYSPALDNILSVQPTASTPSTLPLQADMSPPAAPCSPPTDGAPTSAPCSALVDQHLVNISATDRDCLDVPIGFYSPADDNAMYPCTSTIRLPTQLQIFTSRGGGSDSCTVSPRLQAYLDAPADTPAVADALQAGMTVETWVLWDATPVTSQIALVGVTSRWLLTLGMHEPTGIVRANVIDVAKARSAPALAKLPRQVQANGITLPLLSRPRMSPAATSSTESASAALHSPMSAGWRPSTATLQPSLLAAPTAWPPRASPLAFFKAAWTRFACTTGRYLWRRLAIIRRTTSSALCAVTAIKCAAASASRAASAT